MSEVITSREEYLKFFQKSKNKVGHCPEPLAMKKDNPSESSVREKALECALDIRKFEIDLYWKRAGYFWTLIAVTFTGYFALAASEQASKHPRLSFLLCCIGLVLSIAWYLVNRGSKYWQENWEQHVDLLEDESMGPLYKITIAHDNYKLLHLHTGYPFSVSKVNQIVSFFVVCIWLGLCIYSFPNDKALLPFLQKLRIVDFLHPWLCLILSVMTGFCVFALWYWGSTHKEEEAVSPIKKMIRKELSDSKK